MHTKQKKNLVLQTFCQKDVECIMLTQLTYLSNFHILCQFALKSDQNTIWKKKEKVLFFLNDVKKIQDKNKTTKHSALLVIFSGAKKKKSNFLVNILVYKIFKI